MSSSKTLYQMNSFKNFVLKELKRLGDCAVRTLNSFYCKQNFMSKEYAVRGCYCTVVFRKIPILSRMSSSKEFVIRQCHLKEICYKPISPSKEFVIRLRGCLSYHHVAEDPHLKQMSPSKEFVIRLRGCLLYHHVAEEP